MSAHPQMTDPSSSSSASSAEDAIVATHKYKPSKAALARQQQLNASRQDEVADDWDADSSDEDQAPLPQRAQQDPFQATKQEWSRANEQAPTAVPIVQTSLRSLPSSAYGQTIAAVSGSSSSSSNKNTSSVPAGAPAPPRILQRPKTVAPGVHSDGSFTGGTSSGQQEQKSIQQRQEEYRLARARIFGSAADNKNENETERPPSSDPARKKYSPASGRSSPASTHTLNHARSANSSRNSPAPRQ
ncbi:hypothetical protein BCV70DRAFT_199294 [Testicularia cyperi]|uniref:SUZ domain-containing protein n=1 Tax=Testicularia cyperi TaxID=1882483 RepID=A0A317XRJ7_9BASI|nr:hypothetical protein BCV70DRAFT_199294 [Testicularia cyperi]